MKVELTYQEPVLHSFPAKELPIGKAGVVTKVPRNHEGVRPGDVLLRGAREYVFPKTEMWCTDSEDYLVRALRPGEKIVIEP